jgi:hypothetical protein
VDGGDGVVASNSEGDDEVRLDQKIPFPSSSAVLVLLNDGGLSLNSSVSDEPPAFPSA